MSPERKSTPLEILENLEKVYTADLADALETPDELKRSPEQAIIVQGIKNRIAMCQIARLMLRALKPLMRGRTAGGLVDGIDFIAP